MLSYLRVSYLKANPNEKYCWISIKVGKCYFSLSPTRPIISINNKFQHTSTDPKCCQSPCEYHDPGSSSNSENQHLDKLFPIPALGPLISVNRLGGIVDIQPTNFPRHCVKYWDYNKSKCNFCPQGIHWLPGKLTETVKTNHYYATEIIQKKHRGAYGVMREMNQLSHCRWLQRTTNGKTTFELIFQRGKS